MASAPAPDPATPATTTPDALEAEVFADEAGSQHRGPVTAPPLQAIGRPIPPEHRGGFVYQWGPQAWIDMWMSYSMLVKKAGLLITHTFIPILRLATDGERIDREWAEMKARREKVRLLDSPRERWRKNYGNFVRDAEWALLELRKHFSQEEYEQIVIGTSVFTAHEYSPKFLEMMNSMSDTKPQKKAVTGDGPSKPEGVQALLFEMFNPAGFLTGPAEITEYDPANGSATMYVPECAWHICGAQEALPNPDALPEQGCLLICKGAFEELFAGEGGALAMDFEPHLPATDCTVKMTWKAE
ncbi:MAG: hypothetical protein QF570_05600 [Myxococcota bacterium]|nr:hypothetical protein [Myxococcota bacterium]